MKRIILLIFAFAILNGCAEYSSLVGPSYTMAKSGSVVQVGGSMAASYGLQKTTGQNPSTFINSSTVSQSTCFLSPSLEYR